MCLQDIHWTLRFLANENKRTVSYVICKAQKYRKKSVQGHPGTVAPREGSEPHASVALQAQCPLSYIFCCRSHRALKHGCVQRKMFSRHAWQCPSQMLQCSGLLFSFGVTTTLGSYHAELSVFWISSLGIADLTSVF